eukprot:3784493-Prymnesium_polylepis.1
MEPTEPLVVDTPCSSSSALSTASTRLGSGEAGDVGSSNPDQSAERASTKTRRRGRGGGRRAKAPKETELAQPKPVRLAPTRPRGL